MNLVSIVLISILLVTAQSFGEGPRQPTLEELRTFEALESASGYMEDMKSRIERMSKTKRNKCIRGLGNTAFCQCIADKTPIGTSFEDYVIAAISSDEELDLARLEPEQNKLVTLNRRARNDCVNVSH